MKIYIAVIADRHTDDVLVPFVERQAAIDYAKRKGKEIDRHDVYKEESIDGWEFYASCSCESDHVRVQAVDLIVTDHDHNTCRSCGETYPGQIVQGQCGDCRS